MTTQNIDISIVGKGLPYKKLSEEQLKPFIEQAKAAGDVAMDTSA